MNLNRYKDMVFSLATGVLLLVGLFLLLYEAPQTVRADPGSLFVTAGGGGNCSQANPCDLQTALSTATDGDTLYLTQGTYTGIGGAVISVTHSITLYGGWDGSTITPPVRDPDGYPTVLDGEDSRHVIHIGGDIVPTIDGFIITGGKAEDGGGIIIDDASPLVQNNVITANRTIDGGAYTDGRGGGIYVAGSSTAVIAQNQILSNTSGYGGGIYHNHWAAAITVTANEIAGNVVSYRGGGILVENAPDIVQGNLISGNRALRDGGGMLIFNAAPRVEANRITGNSARSGGGISIGWDATPSLLNNVLVSNARDGLLVMASSPAVINNTIVGSGLIGSEDGIDLRSSPECSPPYCTEGVYTNNIVVSYKTGIRGIGPITPAIDYNDVWGNSGVDYDLPAGVVTGTHNISLNPLFTNPAADDYHLQSDSPCVDAGDPAGVPPAPPTDIDGDGRPIGDRVDIGADEFRWRTIYLPLVEKSYP